MSVWFYQVADGGELVAFYYELFSTAWGYRGGRGGCAPQSKKFFLLHIFTF